MDMSVLFGQINTFGDAFLSLFPFVNLLLFRQQGASLIASGHTGVDFPEI